jgi:hypothetical protein
VFSEENRQLKQQNSTAVVKFDELKEISNEALQEIDDARRELQDSEVKFNLRFFFNLNFFSISVICFCKKFNN